MTTSNTGNPSEDAVPPKEGDATDGDNVVTDDSKKYKDLQKSFNDLQAKSRKQEKDFKELSTKLDAVLSRLAPEDDLDDDDDDDQTPDGGGGGDGNQAAKPQPKGVDPQVNKLLKKLKNERTRAEDELKAERGKTDFWKSKFLKEAKGKYLRDELTNAKPGVRKEALPHLLKLLDSEIEEQVDDEGNVEFVHQSYPNVKTFIAEFLNENQLYVVNERALGTGDGGGAERGGSGAAGFKLPASFQTWGPEKQREYLSGLTPEQRKEIAKQTRF